MVIRVTLLVTTALNIKLTVVAVVSDSKSADTERRGKISHH